jgi:hypothetical protein
MGDQYVLFYRVAPPKGIVIIMGVLVSWLILPTGPKQPNSTSSSGPIHNSVHEMIATDIWHHVP